VTEQSALWRVVKVQNLAQNKKNLAPHTPPLPPPRVPGPSSLSPSFAHRSIFRSSFRFLSVFLFVPAGFRWFMVGVWRTLAPTSSTSTTWHSLIMTNYYYYPGGFFCFGGFFLALLSFHLAYYLMASGLNTVRGAKIRRPASQVGKGQKGPRLFSFGLWVCASVGRFFTFEITSGLGYSFFSFFFPIWTNP
jgi:hypothetical protein